MKPMMFFNSLLALMTARNLLRPGLALLLALSVSATVADSQSNREATPEYKLKAALLFKLTRFVSWPEMDSDDSEFNICVLGDNVFGNTLEPLRDRQANQKTINIEYFDQSADIDTFCDLLFIEESKEPFLSSILERFRTQGVLTISDIRGFAEMGGIVELTLVNSKVGFKVNRSSAKAAELSLAAPLLQLAIIVDEDVSSD